VKEGDDRGEAEALVHPAVVEHRAAEVLHRPQRDRLPLLPVHACQLTSKSNRHLRVSYQGGGKANPRARLRVEESGARHRHPEVTCGYSEPGVVHTPLSVKRLHQ
jgi:hypothetical protein